MGLADLAARTVDGLFMAYVVQYTIHGMAME